MEYISHYNSPLGGITIAADDKGITGLWFDRQKYFGDIKGSTERDVEYLSEARKWLDIYFGGQAPDFTPPLSLSGSEFRKSVARIMLEIPFGQTITYGEIAAMISPKMAAQAVGGAVGHNPYRPDNSLPQGDGSRRKTHRIRRGIGQKTMAPGT